MNVLRLLRGVALAVAAISLLTLAPAAKADLNLVQNGDFTGTSLSSPGGFVCNTVQPTCVSTVTDWSATCGSYGLCGNGDTPLSLLFAGTGGIAFNNYNGLSGPPTDPPSGNYIGDDGDSTYNANFFQTINGLTAGASYLLTFQMAAAQQGSQYSATNEQWVVSLGAQTQDSIVMNTPPAGFVPWTVQTMTFTASSSSELLNFLSVTTPSGVPPIALLADVSLVRTPEPSILTLLAGMGGVLGFLVIGMRRRRRA